MQNSKLSPVDLILLLIVISHSQKNCTHIHLLCFATAEFFQLAIDRARSNSFGSGGCSYFLLLVLKLLNKVWTQNCSLATYVDRSVFLTYIRKTYKNKLIRNLCKLYGAKNFGQTSPREITKTTSKITDSWIFRNLLVACVSIAGFYIALILVLPRKLLTDPDFITLRKIS